MELNIDIILADLKDGKVKRTQQNLEKLNDTLKKYVESGQRDFSITKIGLVSAADGGLAYEALRATRNEHYRTLIKAGQPRVIPVSKSHYPVPPGLNLFPQTISF